MRQRERIGKLFCLDEPKSVNAETFRTIRTNIRYARASKSMKSLLVTSAIQGEGKTTSAANLATVFAQSGKRTLVVDGDLRKPSLHYIFRLLNVVGLTNLLVREAELRDVVQPVDEIGLDVITSGPIPPMPAELLASEGMIELLQEMKETYDMVVIDSPPILPVPDALEMAKNVDGVILVVGTGKVLRENVRKAKKLLDHAEAKLIGAMLNGKKVRRKNLYHYYG